MYEGSPSDSVFECYSTEEFIFKSVINSAYEKISLSDCEYHSHMTIEQRDG